MSEVEFDLGRMALRERYQLLTRLVAPRPIALVGSRGADGIGNLAPFSYFTLGGANPPSCVICPVFDREGRAKDTIVNIEATGEYVINVVSAAMVAQVSQASWSYPRDVDELDEVGFTRAPARVVGPPRVAEAPAGMECRLHQVVAHGDGPLASRYVIGEILHAWAREDVLAQGLPDNTLLDQVGRCGADWYTRVDAGSLFEVGRPQKT